MAIVYTGGTFDMPHKGHVRFLQACRRIAGELGSVVISLNTDEFIEQFKGKKPIMSFDERREILLEFCSVDEVITNTGGADSKPAILRVEPDFIVVGSDWAKKDYYKQMSFDQEWLDDYDIQLCYVPYTEGISTTDLKRRVNEY
jgi:glycerol-3-phosphate cytidylyltransferase